MSTEPSLSTAENQTTTPSSDETTSTNESSTLSIREGLVAALEAQQNPEPAESRIYNNTIVGEQSGINVAADAQVETEQPETQAQAVIDAPANWPAEKRELFAKLPNDLQAYLSERERESAAEFTRKTTELAEHRKKAEEITGLFEPYKNAMELNGMTPVTAIQRFLAAQKLLDTNPTEALKWLAQSYQVDLGNLVPKQDEYTDPEVAKLRAEVQTLKNQHAQRIQAEANQNVLAAQKQISDFRETKNEDGSSKYPHFDKVSNLMGPLVAQGKTLAEAYEVVRFTLPEEVERVKAEVAKTAQAEALKKAEEARKAKAKDAKTTAPIIRSRGTAAEESGKPLSIRQGLEAALRDQQGRI